MHAIFFMTVPFLRKLLIPRSLFDRVVDRPLICSEIQFVDSGGLRGKFEQSSPIQHRLLVTAEGACLQYGLFQSFRKAPSEGFGQLTCMRCVASFGFRFWSLDI